MTSHTTMTSRTPAHPHTGRFPRTRIARRALAGALAAGALALAAPVVAAPLTPAKPCPAGRYWEPHNKACVPMSPPLRWY